MDKSGKMLNTITYNLFKGERESQLDFLKQKNADILFLQECSVGIGDKLDHYNCLITHSHCGFTCLAVKNAIFHNVLKFDGIIVALTEICGYLVYIGSMHMCPSKQNSFKREIQLMKISEFIQLDIPCLLGGDTNMRKSEDDIVDKYDFIDVFKTIDTDNSDGIAADFYIGIQDVPRNIDQRYTYPNPNRIECMALLRYDRFFTRKVSIKHYEVLYNNVSDHLAVEIKFEFLTGNNMPIDIKTRLNLIKQKNQKNNEITCLLDKLVKQLEQFVKLYPQFNFTNAELCIKKKYCEEKITFAIQKIQEIYSDCLYSLMNRKIYKSSDEIIVAAMKLDADFAMLILEIFAAFCFRDSYNYVRLEYVDFEYNAF